RTHRLQREVADDGMDQRRVRPPGELAEAAVVDARAEVVRVADHRGAGRAGDGRLDLAFHGRERPLDDLQEDRVRHSLHGSFHGLTPFGGSQPAYARVFAVMTRLPWRSSSAVKPGCSGIVEPNSSMTAGPSIASPGASLSRR